MAGVNFKTTTIRSEEIALPAFASAMLDEEDHDGFPYVRGGGTAILANGSSLTVSIVGHRAYADFGGPDLTDAEVKLTLRKCALARGPSAPNHRTTWGFRRSWPCWRASSPMSAPRWWRPDMPTIWHKDRWWAGDLVPPFGTPAVWALPLGIYCEDQETFAALRRAAWENEPADAVGHLGQASIGGIAIFVATPEQAALFRAMPARSVEESLAEQQALVDAFAEKIDRLQKMVEFGTVPRPGASSRPFKERRPSTVTNAIASGAEFLMGREPAPPPEVRHPFSGANRKAKRAAKSKARRWA